MKKTSIALLSLGALAALCTVASAKPSAPELKTVSHVDLQRYAGRWYEIAKYPNRFERECDRDTMAEYSLLPGGEVEVVNSCTMVEGKQKVSKGKAKIVDPKTNSKLKVTFFWPFYGDYWIIDLDPNYRWVVVGEPRRKYLWILSRTPHMDAAQFHDITARLASKGYDAAKLVPMKQSKR